MLSVQQLLSFGVVVEFSLVAVETSAYRAGQGQEHECPDHIELAPMHHTMYSGTSLIKTWDYWICPYYVQSSLEVKQFTK